MLKELVNHFDYLWLKPFNLIGQRLEDSTKYTVNSLLLQGKDSLEVVTDDLTTAVNEFNKYTLCDQPSPSLLDAVLQFLKLGGLLHRQGFTILQRDKYIIIPEQVNCISLPGPDWEYPPEYISNIDKIKLIFKI